MMSFHNVYRIENSHRYKVRITYMKPWWFVVMHIRTDSIVLATLGAPRPPRLPDEEYNIKGTKVEQ